LPLGETGFQVAPLIPPEEKTTTRESSIAVNKFVVKWKGEKKTSSWRCFVQKEFVIVAQTVDDTNGRL
jgi:hypothetical protein